MSTATPRRVMDASPGSTLMSPDTSSRLDIVAVTFHPPARTASGRPLSVSSGTSYPFQPTPFRTRSRSAVLSVRVGGLSSAYFFLTQGFAFFGGLSTDSVTIWCLPSLDRGNTSTSRSPWMTAMQASTTPVRLSSSVSVGESWCADLPDGRTLHLPHLPSPPHTASICMPARLAASSTVVPVLTSADLPSGLKTTVTFACSSMSIWPGTGLNRMRVY